MHVHSKPAVINEEDIVADATAAATAAAESNANSYYDSFSSYVGTRFQQIRHKNARSSLLIGVDRNTVNVHQIQTFSYTSWLKSPSELKRCKHDVLKATAKQIGLRVSGTKPELIQRIHARFSEYTSAIRIQRVFRGYLVRESERLRGPASKCPDICTNQSDFQTMDLLADIPHTRFFSYRDLSGFIYGFDVCSLIHMFQAKRTLFNPYNREKIPIPILCNVYSLYKKTQILYPLDKCQNVNDTKLAREIHEVRRDWAIMGTVSIPDTFDIDNPYEFIPPVAATAPPLESVIERQTRYSQQIIQDMIAGKSVIERVEMAFDYIRDLLRPDKPILGEWFMELSRTEYDRFYHLFYMWWERHSNYSAEEKWEICGLHNPFDEMESMEVDGTRSYFMELCLRLIEKMIYTGTYRDTQSIGAQQVLIILAVSSKSARRVWPELFENW